MINIYAFQTEKIEETIFGKLLQYLSIEKRDRIIRLRNIEDAKMTLFGDVLVRIIVCNRFGIKNKDIVFDKNEYGKPFLKGFNNFHFNISHSGGWVVCATHSLPVGIDIEKVKQANLKIAEHFFSEYENNDLTCKDSSEKLSYFYDLWTLKESYIKAEGKGLFIPLNSFSISINNSGITLKTAGGLKQCCFKQYSFQSDYKLAICGYEDNFSEEIIVKNLNNMELSLLGKI